MKSRSVLCFTLGVATLSACAPAVSPEEAESIANEVQPILMETCARGGALLPASYPPSISALHPNAVRMAPEGMYVETWEFMAAERGVFIPCQPGRFAPQKGSDPSYEAVGNGVYTYYIAG